MIAYVLHHLRFLKKKELLKNCKEIWFWKNNTIDIDNNKNGLFP